MRYYISDLHFCHDKLNERMDRRGFESVDAMNEYMIRQWNSKVKPRDEVVILGDFCMSRDAATVHAILDRLQGEKYLIIGNHDKYLKDKDFDTSKFKWIEHYKELKDNKRKIILSHYPIMCYNGQYSRNAEGEPRAYMLYGHVHNTYDEYIVNEHQKQISQYRRPFSGTDEKIGIPCQMINCFCMFSDYVPLTLDEWIQLDRDRRAKITVSDYETAEEPDGEMEDD